MHGMPEAHGYIAASFERWLTARDFAQALERAEFGVLQQVLRLGGGIAIHLARKQR